MKAILILFPLFLVYCLRATNGQNADKRFETFLRNSLSELPNWMREHGYIPDPLQKGSESFYLQSSTSNYYRFLYLDGAIKNRFYHGAEKNIQFLELTSNLSSLSFKFDLAFGDGENDSVEGTYELDGSILYDFPIRGNGSFRKTNLLTTNPLHVEMECNLEFTSDGYFRFVSCLGEVPFVRFANFTLDGFGGSILEKDIQSMVDSWYHVQMNDFPNTDAHWFNYMSQLFQVTPIIEILGTALPSTVTASATEKVLKAPIYTRKPYLDMGKNELMQKISITF